MTALEVQDVTVRFGGVTAVKSLDLRAETGQITGLIGPNGAGKTTTFNVCSGFTRPTHGQIRYDGHDLTHASAAHRAKVGIGRTFQRIELFDSLSVADNVAVGREAGLAGTSPFRQLWPRRGERRSVLDAAQRALELCGITDLRDDQAGSLSTGQKRLVELARALAGNFSLLLLDEPSSGLDASESEDFIALLRGVVAETGVGVLIVEHDMNVIADLCDAVYVLDFGQLIFSGTAHEVLTSDVVRAAYLGTEALPAGVTG